MDAKVLMGEGGWVRLPRHEREAAMRGTSDQRLETELGVTPRVRDRRHVTPNAAGWPESTGLRRSS